MKTNNSFYPVLFENPNAVYYDKVGTVVDWTQVRSLAFSYYGGMMYIGSGRSTHLDLYKQYNGTDELAKSREGRGKYAGRVYTSLKIISFWEFPENKKVLQQILNDIEEETSIHFDNSWRVEVPLNYNNTASWGTWHPSKNSQEFVPIDKYDGGFSRSEEEMKQKHIMSPIEKEAIKKKHPVLAGFGSDKTAWDSPNNIKVRQTKYTSESLNL